MTMIQGNREYIEKLEQQHLASYASHSAATAGRQYTEKSHLYRTEYQRDRDRIIHSKAFRRLEYKTQVFINHEGDHFRTRLTHTIEVAQIARSISRALRLNEDLAESIALAHDLGHTPFGHAGERELDKLLKDTGGFEHNRQSLRVVDVLEKRYPDFDGLNLTWETREGIIKHSSDYDHPDASDFAPGKHSSLEAQLIDIADEIAYNNHDLDDGLSSHILHIEDIEQLTLWKMAKEQVAVSHLKDEKEMIYAIIRSIINLLVSDLIVCTQQNIETHNIKTVDDVRNADRKIACFSDEIIAANRELKDFLKQKLYQHYRVSRMTLKAEKVITDLYTFYTEHPEILDDEVQERCQNIGTVQAITDYIAGMTDRYAIEEHKKLTDPLTRV